jgi:CheY-like chemotaxis protein
MMPVMDGWEFRRRQVSDATIAAVPVVVLSALDPGRAGELGGRRFLKKPLDFDHLLETRDVVSAPRPADNILNSDGTLATIRFRPGGEAAARALVVLLLVVAGLVLLQTSWSREQLRSLIVTQANRLPHRQHFP